MKQILLSLLALGATITVSGQQDKRLKGLEKELNEILSVTKAPGFAVAIVEGKKVIYSKGFGYSDYENKKPADANTLFAIGSATKAFTSAILGQLEHQGKLSLDDSPIKYIPELRFFNSEMNDGIIIKDLMTHRTGLPRHDYSWYMFPGFNKDSLIKRIQYQEPFTGVRKQWMYNNFMFLAQGIVAERITGKSWEDNIRERFLKPLGMTRSNVGIDEMKESTNAALGYELKKDSIISKMDYYNIAGMSPAGSINSSVNEMSNWLIPWLNNGKFNGGQIIPETFLTQAIGSQMVINAALPDKQFPDMHLANYGYGWFISSYKGHYRVEHGGNIDGFSASVAFYPSDSLGIVVLANQNGSAVPYLVRNSISDRMLKVVKGNWSAVYKERKAKAKKEEKEAKAKFISGKKESTRPSHNLPSYAGNYSNAGYGDFTISLAKDSLFANFKLNKFYLKHVHYNIFEPIEVKKSGLDSADTGPLRFNFSTGDGGDIDFVHIKLEDAVNPIKFKHQPATIKVDKLSLAKYVGDFELAGMVAKFYLKEDDTLYMFVAGQPEYELVATEKHKFSLTKLDGYKLEFKESADKSINEVILIQPEGSYKAKRK